MDTAYEGQQKRPTKEERHQMRQTRRQMRQTTGQTTRQTTGQTTRQTRQNDDDAAHQARLTNFFESRRGPRIARATEEEQEEAQRIINERGEELYNERHEASIQANKDRAAKYYQTQEERQQRINKTQPVFRALNKVKKRLSFVADGSWMGGSKSKEILGKIRRIYKVAGSRKEHVKYKGELIPVSDYKKLFKK